MAIWTVDFKASVTVEANTEDEALSEAQKVLNDPESKIRDDLEFMDFDAWQE